MPDIDLGPLAGLYTLRQTREALGCSRHHAYWLIRAGELEAVDVDDHKYVTIESVRRFIDRVREAAG